jgi:hypothetical protein
VKPEQAEVSSGTWFFEHLLALLTLGSCAYVYWVLTTFDLAVPLDPQKISVPIVFSGTLSVIAAVVFWIRMSRDFVRRRPVRHAAAWGAFLLIGAHLAALVYFVRIWRPRHRP